MFKKKNVILLFILFFISFNLVGATADSITKVYNYPNPYQPSSGTDVTIRFVYNRQSAITSVNYYLYIYDIIGNKVLVTKRVGAVPLAANDNNVDITWNGNNDKGSRVAPGVYFIKVVTEGSDGNGQVISKFGKMVIK